MPQARYTFQGQQLELELEPEVFLPSALSELFATHIRVKPGESVLDIGTGSGLLALLAAKLGGEVWAKDASKCAVATARANASRNNLQLHASTGSLFSDLDRQFDVIVANLPQTVLNPKRTEPLPPYVTLSLDGGLNGNAVTLELLRQAPAHMHTDSRLYLAVDTLSNYTETLQIISEHYDSRLLAFAFAPLAEVLLPDLNWYQQLHTQGRVTIEQRAARWSSHQLLFELKLRKTSYTPDVHSWVADHGDAWSRGRFNPDAFDPAAPHRAQGETFKLAVNPHHDFESASDLRNLRVVVRSSAERLREQLETLAYSGNRTIVAMLGTGGTIAMRRSSSGIMEHSFEPNYLLGWVGAGLAERFDSAALELPTPIDSSQQEIDYLADLVIVMTWLWKQATPKLRQRLAGFMVIHGTDSMAPSASLVNIMLGPNCPFTVGFVGAQKTVEDRFSDVAPNIHYCLETMATLQAHQLTACFVYMGGTSGGAYPAVGVVKISDRLVNAFDSPVHPKILDITDFAARGVRLHFRDELLAAQDCSRQFEPLILRGYLPVYHVRSEVGENPDIHYRAILSAHECGAVVFRAWGSFTANMKLMRAVMQAARETNKLVFAINPFPAGNTDHVYAPAEALRQSGAIPVHIMGTALNAKLLLAQKVFGNNRQQLIDFVANNNFVGEQQPAYWSSERRPRNSSLAQVGMPQELVTRAK